MRRVYNVEGLLDDYRGKRKPSPGMVVNLAGIPGRDGYNPSRVIAHNGQRYHYVRVEPRTDELSSWAVAFRCSDDACWEVDEALPMFHLQDPFSTVVHGRLVVGGVRILGRRGDHVLFETALLEGESLDTLREFARGPLLMKDIRLVGLPDGKVGVFTRPLGGFAGRGCIGYTEVDGLEGVTMKAIETAPLLESQPIEEHWWGANDVFLLNDGRLGVLGHIAMREDEVRHYYPVIFVVDRETRDLVYGPEIIADRTCFPELTPKRQWLADVIFPAGLDRERGLLFGGLSDAAIGVLQVGDPFAVYEAITCGAAL